MLIDDITIKVFAGKGGRGAVAFNNNLMALGPTGGSGGKGGSVWAEGVSDLGALGQFRFKKELPAENGMDGRSQFRDGHDGQDIVLKLPVGTVIQKTGDKKSFELINVGQRILIAHGGRGGKGNFLFRSARNTSPKKFQTGTPGEQFELHLELKFIADVGFVGYPNVGKSSLLNVLTNAKSKVANYRFTTLEPYLGVYYELILADIPGIIEGASTGKGLGIKFLRHIDRTKVIFHLVSAESADPLDDYKIIRKELGKHNKELLKKEEYVFLSKSDIAPEKELEEKIALFKKKKVKAIPLSILDDASIANVKKILNGIKKEKEVS